mgnify:CR=1 FL=1
MTGFYHAVSAFLEKYFAKHPQRRGLATFPARQREQLWTYRSEPYGIRRFDYYEETIRIENCYRYRRG